MTHVVFPNEPNEDQSDARAATPAEAPVQVDQPVSKEVAAAQEVQILVGQFARTTLDVHPLSPAELDKTTAQHTGIRHLSPFAQRTDGLK